MLEKTNHHGFTLIEILIALAIFAIMATITSLTLANIFKTKATIDEHANSLEELQVAYHLLQQDLAHAVPKMMAASNRRPKGTFIGGLTSFRFNRDNYLDIRQSPPTSRVQLIRYMIDNHQFIREVLNKHHKPITRTTLLHHIDSFAIQYLDRKRYWHEKWLDLQKKSMPAAIGLTLQFKQLGQLKLVLRIPHAHTIKLAKVVQR